MDADRRVAGSVGGNRVVAKPGPPVRGTQSFVSTMVWVWQRPGLWAVELAWRWSFGAPALALVLFKLHGVLMAATGGTLQLSKLGLDVALLRDPVGALSADPVGVVGKFGLALSLVWPGVERFAVWLVPLLLAGWVVQSSVGRTMLLRYVDEAMQIRVGTLMVLQALRVGVLAGVFWMWFRLMGWSARVAVLEPIAQKTEPNLVLYCGLLIVISLGMFTGWALVSWTLGMAPLLAMKRSLGVIASLRAAVSLGAVGGKLAEINLVLGIVKIALIVLAMVFSASPLPFSSDETQTFLDWWWLGVGVLYLVFSDFFHVARLVGYLDLWRAGQEEQKDSLNAVPGRISPGN